MSESTLPTRRGGPSAADVEALFPRASRRTAWSVRSVYARTLAERLMLAALTGLGLFAMGLWMGPMFNSLEDSLVEMSESFGDSLNALFGDFATAEGWFTGEMYSLFAPALLVYVAVSSAAVAFAQEQEEHHIGLLAANPVGRPRLMVEKAAATATHVAIVALLTGLGTWGGVQLGSLDIAASKVAAITAHFLLFGTLVAATAMYLGIRIGRRVPTMVVTAGLVVVAYVWGSFAPQSAALDGLAVLSPWYWYFGSNALDEGVHWAHLALLAGSTLLVGLLALRQFENRDLEG